jgi:hypothetical protein
MLNQPDFFQDTFGLGLMRLVKTAIASNETVYIRTKFNDHYKVMGKLIIGKDYVSFVSQTSSSEILLPYATISEVNRYPAES